MQDEPDASSVWDAAQPAAAPDGPAAVVLIPYLLVRAAGERLLVLRPRNDVRLNAALALFVAGYASGPEAVVFEDHLVPAEMEVVFERVTLADNGTLSVIGRMTDDAGDGWACGRVEVKDAERPVRRWFLSDSHGAFEATVPGVTASDSLRFEHVGVRPVQLTVADALTQPLQPVGRRTRACRPPKSASVLNTSGHRCQS